MIERKTIEKVLSKGFADKLDAPFFTVGTMQFSRRTMIDELGCANFIAAVRLMKVLNRLKIQTSAQLFKLDPGSLARTRGIGESSIFVAMCILSASSYDVMRWWEYKRDNVVKFATYKHNKLTRAKKNKQDVA